MEMLIYILNVGAVFMYEQVKSNNAYKLWRAVKNEWNSFKRFDVPKLSHVVCKMLSQHYTIIAVKCVVM